MRLQIVSLLLCLFCGISIAAPANTSFQHTRQRIARLDQQISQLNGRIQEKQGKKKLLNQELSSTEKAIGEQTRQLSLLKEQLYALNASITQRQKDVQTLLQQQSHQQAHLARHLKSRYQMDTLQIVKSLINTVNPEEISRILTYYQYLIKTRKQIIASLATTRLRLYQEQQALQKQWGEMQRLQNIITLQQKKLEGEKQYQAGIIARLQKDITAQQKKLDDYQADRRALTQLLQKLYHESQQKSSKPFSAMRRKLISPIVLKQKNTLKINKGILFLAPEGQSVQAVFPGKVIFSDWLKGYGLLLILDHGQGYMTLYAHNLSLLHNKGETVIQGEPIATVGHSGGLRENGLYFEIRYRGKAISAQEWIL